ncbi:MAG TPA: hypothetical protein VF403_14845 [Kofleriaceae bacterium]
MLVVGLFAGCGSSTDPSVSGVFPAEGFSGRTVRVEVSGDATTWSTGATVSFGAGITVSNVAVASPTDLFADVAIDNAAAPGLSDVTVSSGGTFTLTQAFEVKSPIDVTFEGDAAQGGLPYLTIVNHDFDNAFDLTADATGALANLTITGPSGTTFKTDSSSTAYSLHGFCFIDGDAMPGTLTIKSGPTATSVTSTIGTVDIKTRAPTALTSGTPTSGSLANVGDSLYYSMPAVAGLVHLTASATGSGAQLAVAILPASGHWADQIGSSFAILPSAGTVNIVLFDNGTASGYTTSLTAVSETLTSAAEPAAPADNTIATALTATLPYEMTGATLSSATTIDPGDYVKVVIDAANATKKLHIIAGGTNPATDTAVDFVSSANTSLVMGPIDGGAPAGQDGGFSCGALGQCNEEVLIGPFAAGTYYIKVTEGAAYDPSANDYALLAWFE